MDHKPKRNMNLPAGMRARHRASRTYYYLDTGGTPRREIPHGSDYALAVQTWAELTISSPPRHADLLTFRYAAKRYQREIKRLQQKGRAVTGTEGRVRANREKALCSRIWNFARERGLTAKRESLRRCARISGDRTGYLY